MSDSGARDRLAELSTRLLDDAPKSPGVYLMKDRAGTIFYIGKAKDLRARLRTYLQPQSSDTRYFVGLLARILVDVEFQLTANEKEALLLESELVKQHQPRFNVKLRDDKSFLHVAIATDDAFPRIDVVRRRKDDGRRYFGPYDSATSIRNTLRIVNRHFGLRTCTDADFRNRVRPCLEHQIGRCPAPCVLSVAEDAYQRSVRDAILFLEGRPRALLRDLGERMQAAAARMDFELAARRRDQIRAIERAMVQQDVLLEKPEDLDVVALVRDGDRAVIEVLRYRDGAPLGARGHELGEARLSDDPVVMAAALQQLYERVCDVPPEILVNVTPEFAEALADLLARTAGRKVRLRQPQRGRKRALIAAAERNGRQRLQQAQGDHARRMDALARLQQRLHLRAFPQRIEGYDISNIHGTDAVGSMVVFSDGAPDPAGYRKFRVRTVEGSDDFAMMAEMLARRFRDGDALGPLPDLVVLDGGRAHLQAVRRALAAEGVTDLEIVALAKERFESRIARRRTATDGGGGEAARRPERVYLPDVKDPVRLPRNDAVTLLLARLRDEAHRFAITFHRKRRARRTIRSALDDVAGVGPRRRAALLSAFGSVEGLRGEPPEAIAERAGVPLGVARAVAEALS